MEALDGVVASLRMRKRSFVDQSETLDPGMRLDRKHWAVTAPGMRPSKCLKHPLPRPTLGTLAGFRGRSGGWPLKKMCYSTYFGQLLFSSQPPESPQKHARAANAHARYPQMVLESHEFPLSGMAQKAISSAWSFLDICGYIPCGHFPQGLRGGAITVWGRSIAG